MNVKEDDKRVLHSNELIEERMAEWKVQRAAQQSEDGFTAGLSAETLELDSMAADQDEEGVLRSNIIKAATEELEELEARKAQAAEEAENILVDARAQAEAILADAQAQALEEKEQVIAQAREQGHQEGYQDGYQNGYQEGQQKAEQEADTVMRQLEQREQELESTYEQRFNELEPKFIDTLTGIYEHIFHVELHSYREILVYLISNTMRKIESGQGILVHVSKEDYPYVSMQKKQIAGSTASPNSTVEIVEDVTLAKNECLIETEGGIFDCGLGTQLAELGQKLRLLSYER
ncbi:MAG: hypothetical protein J1E64_13615 [Acetatifactor sp.]|nr:hypothetical protein [Acetatifactor sp.]